MGKTGRKPLDLVGQLFGRWKVLQKAEDDDRKWVCICSCESKTVRSVYTGSLVSGLSTSCGCYRDEVLTGMFGHHARNAKIIAEYEKGKSIIFLAEKYGVSKQRIHQILVRENVETRRPGRGQNSN
jgi:hypothetical protein